MPQPTDCDVTSLSYIPWIVYPFCVSVCLQKQTSHMFQSHLGSNELRSKRSHDPWPVGIQPTLLRGRHQLHPSHRSRKCSNVAAELTFIFYWCLFLFSMTPSYSYINHRATKPPPLLQPSGVTHLFVDYRFETSRLASLVTGWLDMIENQRTRHGSDLSITM